MRTGESYELSKSTAAPLTTALPIEGPLAMDIDYQGLFENVFDGVYFTDKDRRIIFWNKGAERITGYSSGEVIDSHCWDNMLIHVDDQGHNLCKASCPLAESIHCAAARDAEIYLHHKEGHRVPVWVRTTPLRDSGGTIVGGAELFTDLGSSNAIGRKLQELNKLSFLDNLTQIANRRYLEVEARSRLAEMERYGLPFGLILMDVDGFKSINDAHGHDAGDRLLQAIAKTLIRSTRPFDLCGRWGGDEFLGIVRNVDRQNLEDIGNRVRSLVENTKTHHGSLLLNTTISLGGAMARSSDTMESLVKRADEQLYRSKKAGRNRLCLEPL